MRYTQEAKDWTPQLNLIVGIRKRRGHSRQRKLQMQRGEQASFRDKWVPEAGALVCECGPGEVRGRQSGVVDTQDPDLRRP